MFLVEVSAIAIVAVVRVAASIVVVVVVAVVVLRGFHPYLVCCWSRQNHSPCADLKHQSVKVVDHLNRETNIFIDKKCVLNKKFTPVQISILELNCIYPSFTKHHARHPTYVCYHDTLCIAPMCIAPIPPTKKSRSIWKPSQNNWYNPMHFRLH